MQLAQVACWMTPSALDAKLMAVTPSAVGSQDGFDMTLTPSRLCDECPYPHEDFVTMYDEMGIRG